MKPVEVYMTPICGYCSAAKRLLNAKNVAFTEIDVMANPARRSEMVERSGGARTVPQIFIGGASVGGFDDINALERAGKLDALLAD
ncbi:MAG: glutaredoxin 3 [Pseudomonadota bacterium]